MTTYHEMNFKEALAATETARRLTMYHEGTHADYIILKPLDWQKIVAYLHEGKPEPKENEKES